MVENHSPLALLILECISPVVLVGEIARLFLTVYIVVIYKCHQFCHDVSIESEGATW